MSVADVEPMLSRKASYLYRYDELLKSGTWSGSDPVRAAVADLVRQLGPVLLVRLDRISLVEPKSKLRAWFARCAAFCARLIHIGGG
jgi:hypothetical protein